MTGSTRKLMIAFGILLVVTVAMTTLEKRQTTSRARTFNRIEVEDVTRISINGKGNEVTMEKRGGFWVITEPMEYPANQALVVDLLEKSGELSTVNVVASNPANHDLYEVGTDTGVLVQLFGGQEGNRRMMSVFIGKMTSDFNHTYIRRFSEDDVHTASGLLNGYFNKSVSAWRDRTIFALQEESIEQITVVGEATNYTLARRGSLPEAPDTPWVIRSADGVVAADSLQAMTIVRKVASLAASAFPEPWEEIDADWESPLVTITGRLVDGSSIEAMAFDKPEDTSRYYVKKDGDETVFLMYRSNLDSVLRTVEDLRAKEEAGSGL